MQLVAGQHQVVHGQFAHVDGQLAHGLHRVCVEGHAPFLADGGGFRHGEDGARLVVGEHDGHDGRVLADGLAQFVQVHAALVVHAQQGQFVAVLFQVLRQAEHGGVLYPCGDDVLLVGLGGQRGTDGGVVALGPARGEHDLLRRGPDEPGHLFARLAHGAAHLPAKGVHGRGVAVQFAEIGQHGRKHGRVHAGGGVVVEVDRVHAAASLTTMFSSTWSRRVFSTKPSSVRRLEGQLVHMPRRAT